LNGEIRIARRLLALFDQSLVISAMVDLECFASLAGCNLTGPRIPFFPVRDFADYFAPDAVSAAWRTAEHG